MSDKPSFFAELKRRKDVRMAGLYLVGAWLLLQWLGWGHQQPLAVAKAESDVAQFGLPLQGEGHGCSGDSERVKSAGGAYRARSPNMAMDFRSTWS